MEEALEIDRTMGTDFWSKAINKEMSRVKVAWKAKEGHTPKQARAGQVPNMAGYQEIGCHLVFDVKNGFHLQGQVCCRGSHC